MLFPEPGHAGLSVWYYMLCTWRRDYFVPDCGPYFILVSCAVLLPTRLWAGKMAYWARIGSNGTIPSWDFSWLLTLMCMHPLPIYAGDKRRCSWSDRRRLEPPTCAHLSQGLLLDSELTSIKLLQDEACLAHFHTHIEYRIRWALPLHNIWNINEWLKIFSMGLWSRNGLTI